MILSIVFTLFSLLVALSALGILIYHRKFKTDFQGKSVFTGIAYWSLSVVVLLWLSKQSLVNNFTSESSAGVIVFDLLLIKVGKWICWPFQAGSAPSKVKSTPT